MSAVTRCLGGLAFVVLFVGQTAGVAAAAEVARLERVSGNYLGFAADYPALVSTEWASHLAAMRPPSEFPHLSQVGQFWQGYGEIVRVTSAYPVNVREHLKVLLIGLGSTAACTAQALYEGTVGRLSEATVSHGPTAEDRYAAKTAQDYADFVRTQPGYYFDYAGRAQDLWTTLPPTGDDMPRKWERRFALTSEYGTKALYGWALRKLLRALDLDPPAHSTPDHRHGDILVSLLLPTITPRLPEPARELFSQRMLTQPGTERRVLIVPAAQLAATLRTWRAQEGVTVERLYDR